jgi:hypothetical protein
MLLVLVAACLAPLAPAQEVQAPHGSHQDDVATAEKELKAARDLGDELIVGSKLVALGKAHLWPGEEKLALDCFNQALTTMHAAGGDQEGEAAALQGIGEAYIRLGEMQKALTNLNQALALWRAAHDPYDEVTPLNEIGDVYAKMGMKEKASEFHARAKRTQKVVDRLLLQTGGGGPGAASESQGVPMASEQAPPAESQQPPGEMEPPSITCSASPTVLKPGESATVTALGVSPSNRPLTYGFQASGGTISGSGPTATLTTAGSGAGPVAITCSVSDDNGQTATASASVDIEARSVASVDSATSADTTPSSRNAESQAPMERYPSIEAPDTVRAGQEIAVQVSLTEEQIAPETKIVAGAQGSGGKVQLQMSTAEKEWTLTVNLTAPGMEFARDGTNTREITIRRSGDSTVALFYLRAKPLSPENAAGSMDSKILATLWHDGAFIARLSRPLTIQAAVQLAAQSEAGTESKATAAGARPIAMASAPAMGAAQVHASGKQEKPVVKIDPTIAAPDLTIIENRIGNMLRLTLYSAKTAPVEADIPNADELHNWINAHYAQMASKGRSLTPDVAARNTTSVQAADYLEAFGAELYDKLAPQAFKDLYFKIWPDGNGAGSIQVFSDDPSLPWELMRPALRNGTGRGDFLGARFSIARWPLSRKGMARPPQSVAMEHSLVIAPKYRGTATLTAAADEVVTLRNQLGFRQISGNYAEMRAVATNPPQGIVHFAGHGEVLEQAGVTQYAIVLEDGDIDPGTWESLGSAATRSHPLFFFNACDVGGSQQFMNDVDGWAPALLGNGASGYIGALWPVKDSTAAQFATVFYALLNKSLAAGGQPNVAELLTRTRTEVFSESHDATALAYVFYGDPKLVLTGPEQQ